MGNNYVYCHNNPLSYVDPDGNFPWLAAGVVWAATAEVTRYFRNRAKSHPIPPDVQERMDQRYRELTGEEPPPGPNSFTEAVLGKEGIQSMNDAGIYLGHERVMAKFDGVEVTMPGNLKLPKKYTKYLKYIGDIDITHFDGKNTRDYVSGISTSANWDTNTSAMLWDKAGGLWVYADMGGGDWIGFYEHELLIPKYVKKWVASSDWEPISGLAKYDVAHLHIQWTRKNGNSYLSIRPTVGLVSKVNVKFNQNSGTTTTRFTRSGPFIEFNMTQINNNMFGNVPPNTGMMAYPH